MGLPRLFTTFSDDTPDVKRFAQVRSLKSLTCEGKCSCRRAKPAHFGGHLPEAPYNPEVVNLSLKDLVNDSRNKSNYSTNKYLNKYLIAHLSDHPIKYCFYYTEQMQ